MASDPNATLVFLHLLTEARREPKENRRYGYTVQRGQTDLTLGQLSELTSLSVGQVRQALGRLEKYETIERSTQNGKVPALTTIVNFDTYNPDTNGNSTQGSTSATDERHINDTSTTTPGEVEKGKKEEKTTLPADKPPKPRKPHWSEPAGSRLAKLTGCPKSGPWSFLSKLAREQTESAVLDALARFPWDRALNWKHATGWITEAAKSIHSTAPAPDDYEDRLD